MQLKIKVNDNLQTQGCSSILHPLIRGLTGNTCGHFTTVVILKKLYNLQNIRDCYLSNQHEKISLHI